MTKDRWENTVWDTDIYLDDIDKLDEKKYKCGSAKTCEYGDMCKPKYDIGGCSHYTEKRPQTNEEWLRSCTTEELAEFIRKQRDDWSDGWYSDWHSVDEIIEWLKQPHTP